MYSRLYIVGHAHKFYGCVTVADSDSSIVSLHFRFRAGETHGKVFTVELIVWRWSNFTSDIYIFMLRDQMGDPHYVVNRTAMTAFCCLLVASLPSTMRRVQCGTFREIIIIPKSNIFLRRHFCGESLQTKTVCTPRWSMKMWKTSTVHSLPLDVYVAKGFTQSVFSRTKPAFRSSADKKTTFHGFTYGVVCKKKVRTLEQFLCANMLASFKQSLSLPQSEPSCSRGSKCIVCVMVTLSWAPLWTQNDPFWIRNSDSYDPIHFIFFC